MRIDGAEVELGEQEDHLRLRHDALEVLAHEQGDFFHQLEVEQELGSLLSCF
jgi:hypothetical protein